MHDIQQSLAKAQTKLRKLLRSCLTQEEEREMWRYFLKDCPDDKLRATMFKTWIDRYHGPVVNRNLNLNHTITHNANDEPSFPLALRQQIRAALDKEQTVDAEFKVIEAAPIADPSSEQLDELITIKADLQRIKREMHEKSN